LKDSQLQFIRTNLATIDYIIDIDKVCLLNILIEQLHIVIIQHRSHDEAVEILSIACHLLLSSIWVESSFRKSLAH